jgi:hypothetical protein
MDALTLVLAGYYITHALTATEGPWGAFYRLQRVKWLPFHCNVCTAFWAALAVCVLYFLGESFVVTILATAGGVTLIFKALESLY